jgi:imidazole glycerol-phosphate synthase subunit HisH
MIAILGYGLGNIRAFQNIYEQLNIACTVATEVSHLHSAEKFILPGVGAFDHAMLQLASSGLKEALIHEVIANKKPVLGVCVGMQMLADSSEEGKETGLGWISGTVRKMKFVDGAEPILPHMGWNEIDDMSGHRLLKGLDRAAGFYFLHTYYFDSDDEHNSIAMADYAGRFSCAVAQDHIMGVQFHPEKSHHNGIRLLQNFAEI